MDWDLKLGQMMEEEEEEEKVGFQRSPAASRRRRAPSSSSAPLPVTCLVDGCSWDLNNSREYHRRHRVCERHSKTPVVLVAGEEQRFCQQCSRFHSLGEFDFAKRSCRKRLDGHNRRRRKTQLESVYINSSTSTPTTTLIPPPPPLLHTLMRPPTLMYPLTATAWPVAAPPPPLPTPPHPIANSSPFFYVGTNHSDKRGGRSVDGYIDCALSLLSSGNRVQAQQHQQGFHGGACTSAAAHCYEGFDDHDEDGSACQVLPFS